MDDLDTLDFEGHYEDPDRYEEAIANLAELAKSDPSMEELLLKTKMHPHRERVFQEFDESPVPDAIIKVMASFGINADSRVCDVGCGPGHMAWSMMMRGFEKLYAMDPNRRFLTGT